MAVGFSNVIEPAGVGGAALAIGLGANLPSPAGGPGETLLAVRPRLEGLLHAWAGESCVMHWSPLIRSAPVGGPPGQPDYVNAALVVELRRLPSQGAAQELLHGLQQLELAFGRQRLEHWGPRSLDLDLLWWGELRCDSPALQLPHPRWHQRAFVLAPLRAIERRTPFQIPTGFPPLSVLLEATQG
ncbi:2-amino-4-hydroxy-6-hydroxymethyldihydropteridine diphosphokinase [Synechococcus sp. HK05]|uniref:2-amino-4-hydroxy-6- hydroxymethyldihydropteridine diphosphokinase n=1 Tax=Synechococcus sp. HK05 TaxID=2725975 RepID=UPI001C38DA48|nr:2-amino-4-hydroxy-6-hydroxymethyldihydropteridine diphosphokinase [Synechococcus sp. HK05]MBV2352023.1 2-amino-4-hydroxy-6-hydroxymethyldihydropteridine diphosphokinase [Synechococcus sp. HK05]